VRSAFMRPPVGAIRGVQRGFHSVKPLGSPSRQIINRVATAQPTRVITRRVMNSQPAAPPHAIQTSAPSVKYWLAGGAALVYGIIMVGGITRLTESGLSMVHWNFQGSLPPRGDKEWQEEFDKYKEYPEFKRLFPSMTLEEFKNIYFWEYLHRMWGRAIGLYVALPVAYYAATKKIQGPLLRRCLWLTAGVGVQGLIGWWMVKSGLEEPTGKSDQPRVSQYRLATHLGAAFTLYSGMLWTAMDLWSSRVPHVSQTLASSPQLLQQLKTFRRSVAGTVALVATTALSGAFVAGLDAGLAYNMFPYMEEGRFKAENAWSFRRLVDNFDYGYEWLKDNLFDNTASVQFNHRVLAVSSVSVIGALHYYSRNLAKHLPRNVQLARHALLGVAVAQVTMGICTLLWLVPVKLAAAHQAGSVALLSTSMWLLHALRRIR